MNSFKLLLVEDDPLLGEALYEALNTKGFNTRLAKSGAEALAAAEISYVKVKRDIQPVYTAGAWVRWRKYSNHTLQSNRYYPGDGRSVYLGLEAKFD